jgi:lysophospholipase L1-like esterase
MWAWDIENWWRVNCLNNHIWNLHLKNDADYGMVYNLGIDWDTSSWLLKRFEVECEARQPNVIIFAIGSNDCTILNNNENLVSLDMFQKNISILYQMAKQFTDKIIFVWPIICDENKTIPIPYAPEMSQDMKNTTTYNNAIKEFCEQKNIFFINMIDVLGAWDLEDGMHPTSKWHEKMYILIKDFLIEKTLLSN